MLIPLDLKLTPDEFEILREILIDASTDDMWTREAQIVALDILRVMEEERPTPKEPEPELPPTFSCFPPRSSLRR